MVSTAAPSSTPTELLGLGLARGQRPTLRAVSPIGQYGFSKVTREGPCHACEDLFRAGAPSLHMPEAAALPVAARPST